MKVVNWNVQWATPASGRSPEILCRIGRHDPDIVCLTETDRRLLGERRLSDHFGVVSDLSVVDAPQNPPQKSERYDNQQSSIELAAHHRA